MPAITLGAERMAYLMYEMKSKVSLSGFMLASATMFIARNLHYISDNLSLVIPTECGSSSEVRMNDNSLLNVVQ